MKALLLRALGGQLQDLCVAVKQLAGVAGCCSCLHLVTSQHPHLNACLVQRLYGIGCFFLKPVVRKIYYIVYTVYTV